MTDLRIEHDFNDRELDGSYSVWIPPGTQVTLYDEDGTEERCVAEGNFIDVRRLPQRTT